MCPYGVFFIHIVDNLNLSFFTTMLLLIDEQHLSIRVERHTHVYMVHCECQLTNYHNTVIVSQYLLEKYRSTLTLILESM